MHTCTVSFPDNSNSLYPILGWELFLGKWWFYLYRERKKERNILCLPLMKIIIGMFFFSNFFLSHVHHRKDSTAKLNSVIVNCSFRLGTVTGVYHLMLCKCFRAMSQTGLFTALMQAEVLLVFCSLSHIGSLSKKKERWLCFLSHVFVLCASCRSIYSTTCECIEGQEMGAGFLQVPSPWWPSRSSTSYV